MILDLNKVKYLDAKDKTQEAKVLCENLGYTFLSGSGRSIDYLCVKHGKRTTNIHNLRKERGCVLCEKEQTQECGNVGTLDRKTNIVQVKKQSVTSLEPARHKGKKTWDFYEPLCTPLIPDGITLLGYVEPWNGSRTNLRLSCAVHGEWQTTRVRTVIDCGGISCPVCRKTTRQLAQEDVQTLLENSGTDQIKFVGILGEWKGSTTRVRYSCSVHGEYDTTTVAAALKRGPRCIKCHQDRNKTNCLKDDEYHIKDFMATGRFNADVVFTRLPAVGKNQRWNLWCPTCAEDEFSKAGVGSGNFICSQSNLKPGNCGCRCSGRTRFTKEQWYYKVEKSCEKRGYTFVKFTGRGPYAHRRVIYNCPDHGQQSIMAQSLTLGSGCPECAGRVQKEAYINVIFDDQVQVGLKFGISIFSEGRLYQQNRNNMLKMEQIGVWVFPDTASCRAAEKECLCLLTCGIVSSRELADGWTETTSVLNYDKIVEIYERFGGSKV